MNMDDKSIASTAVRQARARYKQRAKAGEITFGEVVIPAPVELSTVRLADIVEWGWPRLGEVRQARIGKISAHCGINLLLPLGKASRATRTSFVEIVGDVRGEPQQYASQVHEVVADDDFERLGWLLKKAQLDLANAEEKIAELQRTQSSYQHLSPMMEAERMVADMADAVEVHRRTVTSKTAPPEKWANADEELWATKNAILAGGKPALKAVA